MKIKKIIRSISAPKETSGVLWVSPEGFNYFEEGVWKLVDDATFADIYNKVANKADKADLPNDVGRTATDVGFAHVEGGNVEYLFWLRQADSTKAGAMIAADKVKLDALPTNAALTTLLDNKQDKYLVESITVPLTGCGLFPDYRNILQASEGNYQLITPIVLHKGDKVTITCSMSHIYFSTNAFVEGLQVTRKAVYDTSGTYTYTADEDGYYGFATVGTITSITKEGVITVEETLDEIKSSVSTKQDTLTAGNNITINANNVISATDTKYKAGNGLSLSSTTFSVNTAVVATKTDLNAKQDTLSAGNGISISNNTVSSTVSYNYDSITGVLNITTVAAPAKGGASR